MCDYFWRPTDQGDLADVVLPGGRTSPASSSSLADLNPISADWQLTSDQTMTFNELPNPFLNVGDTLLHELTGVEFFDSAEFEAAQVKMAMAMGSRSYGGDVIIPQGEEVKRPCSIFPRVVQISPGVGVACKPPSPLAAAGQIMKVSSSSVDPGGGVQISSPQTPGMKRRKNQAKKVVCIPAPAAAAASNRSTGEVVPSDLWAWRKYGQKPIKGSPHPRGYYRCSSSKGCSARKQVERSRTDPNMLVITYTSEHNHPWPTQRNALAGSTRSQPSKSSDHGLKLHVFGKDELKEVISSAAPLVNEEESAINDSIEDADIDEVFDQGYKLIIPEADRADDFFTDLTGLDPDPMSPILSNGIVEAMQSDHAWPGGRQCLG